MKHSSLFPPFIKLGALDSLLNPDEATVDRAVIHTANRAMLMRQRYEELRPKSKNGRTHDDPQPLQVGRFSRLKDSKVSAVAAGETLSSILEKRVRGDSLLPNRAALVTGGALPIVSCQFDGCCSKWSPVLCTVRGLDKDRGGGE